MAALDEKTETPLERIARHKIDSVILIIDGIVCTVDIIKPECNPTVKYFVGQIDLGENHFFISADVPEQFREAFIAHELRCLSEWGKKGHCKSAVNYEQKFIPRGEHKFYFQVRLRMYKDLVAYFEQEGGDPNFIDELKASRDLVATLYSECDRRYD